MITIIVALCFLTILSCLIFQFLGRYLYDYRISKTCIKIVLLAKIPLFRIPFSNIIEIRKISFKEGLGNDDSYSALKFGNRIWGEGVLIRRKKGLFKKVLITPDKPDEFISKIPLSAVREKEWRGET